MAQTIDYKNFKLNRLKDPEYAKGYLNAALSEYFQDKNNKAFLIALKDIVTAQQNMTKLAKNSSKSRQSLYKSLSQHGNPTFHTLTEVMTSLGYKLSVELDQNK